MEKSESINELALALSKFQGVVKDVVRDKEVKVWDSREQKMKVLYKYGDLQQVLEMARPLLCEHELTVIQLCGNMRDEIVLETMLAHSSGQWVMSKTILPFEAPQVNKEGKKINKDAQSAAGSISFARRYAYCSILGIAQMDDYLSSGSTGYSTPVNAKVESVKEDTTEMVKELYDLIDKHQIQPEVIDKWKQHYKVGTLSTMQAKGLRSIIKTINEKVGASE